MFNFIKKLFKKEQKAETVVKTPREDPVVKQLEELEETRKAFEERAAIRRMRLQESTDSLKKHLKELGVVYKFQDIQTGEIHEVQVDDQETYDKMFYDKNMKMIFD